jgi:hypothetical protein
MVVWVANNLNANFVLKTGERLGLQHLLWQIAYFACRGAPACCLPRRTTRLPHADDDAYVDCERLVADLRSRCRNPDCRNERLYMGEEKRNGDVILDAVSSEPNWL